VKWAQSDEAGEIYLVSEYLRVSAKEAMDMRQNDPKNFYLTLGFAIRKRKDMVALRGIL
jgi:hypothetical protein